MFPPEYAALLYRELEKIATRPDAAAGEQVAALNALMERLFGEATRREQIAFSSLFARISYVGHLFNLQAGTLRRVHHFRLAARWVRNGRPATEQDVALGLQALAETVLLLSGSALPPSLLALLPATPEPGQAQDTDGALGWTRSARVVALQDVPEHNCLIVRDESMPGQNIRVRYGLPERNEHFMPTIAVLRKVFGFPVTLQLLDVDIDPQGDYLPRAFVIEPDYLVDVSAIAECFKDSGPEPYSFLVRKFLPHETTEAILLGNIANFFLDRLLNEPEAKWDALFRETFQAFPLAYAPLPDSAVKSISGKAQKHYLTLKQMAQGGFERQGIDPENCFLEPSFFSELYGIQGRLDLFYRTDAQAAIVELKSGVPFKPNSYGISRGHFTQTLLYDLLVRSVYGQGTDPAKYILYSGEDTKPLRFAPTVVPEQWEALQVRNQMLTLERLLTQIRPGDLLVPVFGRLRASLGKGFTARDFAQFEAAYAGLSDLEKKYFNACCGFIAREQWLAKIGEESSEQSWGHAALWRSDFCDKQQNFSILSHLEIIENRADQPEPSIVFRRGEQSNPLANFRVGDIAVLYPALEETDNVLQHQVIKCTITALSATEVQVQPRYRQFNLKPFDVPGNCWRLEPDLMDTGFASMYRSLLEWASAAPERRGVVLGCAPAPTPSPSPPGRGAAPLAGAPGGADGVALAATVALTATGDDVVALTATGDLMATEGVEVDSGTVDKKLGDEEAVKAAATAVKAATSAEQGAANAAVKAATPLPRGEGPGVGSPRKTAALGLPHETTTYEQWQYLKPRARLHRKFPTEAEDALWQALRDKKVLGVKFRRQHPIDQFIVDFVSLEHLLVIEVDGEIHLGQQAKDAARTARLVELGFKVMRFENQEVLQDMKSVLVRIEHMIQHPAPTPSPSPPGRGAAPLAGAPDGADGVALAATVALTATGDDVVALTATGDDVVALAATGDLMATEGVEVDSGTVDKKSGDEEAVKAAATAVKAATSAEQGAANAAEQAATPLPRGEGPGVGFGFGYHLLWGPPGTGKTSVMLRDMAAAVLRDTTDNLLILAYTNRAVDEICEALQTIGGDIERQYLRIGSRHATAERFRGQLLQHKIAGAKTRAELRSVLDSHRVFVSTLASFSQNEGLTRLKKFQRLIVDEASQILEPQIIGLLTRFEHFTLIGDHRQLPAVTAQRPESTRVADEELLGIGLTDLRESYFERLYRRCISQGWHWAYDQLQRQGRMHRDIMDFPNRHFYGGMLQTLEGPAGERQHQALDHAASALPTEDTPLAVLRQKRVVFLDCPPMSHAALHRKTSLEEAEVAARIVLFFKNLYEKTGKPWRAGHTLGIITPWRAQIAQLRSTLSAAGIDPDALTIDTVERYQGGARDIIILSTCVHTPQQLDSLVSMGEGGVDRKLNVALTRAREQLIMLGNADILRLDERYRAFIEAYG